MLGSEHFLLATNGLELGDPRTLLDSGIPGAGGGWARPGQRLLALGFPSSSGFSRFGSGRRHGGPNCRSSRRLVFLVLAAHCCSRAVDSFRPRFWPHNSSPGELFTLPGSRAATLRPPSGLLRPGLPRNWSDSPGSASLPGSGNLPSDVCRASRDVSVL
jgi:hypothetical protein